MGTQALLVLSGILPSRLVLSQQTLNAAHTDLELPRKFTHGRPASVAGDKALYIRPVQPIIDPPDTRNTPGTDATRHLRPTNITTP